MDCLKENPVTKKDSTVDLLTIMLDRVMVTFKVGPGNYETKLGLCLHVSDLHDSLGECVAYCYAGMISFKVLYIRSGPE